MSSTLIQFEIPIADAEQITDEQRIRQEFIASLVWVAKFFHDNPHLPIPVWTQTIEVWPQTNAKAMMAQFAKALGSVNKDYGDTTFTLVKPVGCLLNFKVWGNRDEICERVVVGKEVVPAHTVPAKAAQFVPEHEVEKVEWRCSSILANGVAALESPDVNIEEDDIL